MRTKPVKSLLRTNKPLQFLGVFVTAAGILANRPMYPCLRVGPHPSLVHGSPYYASPLPAWLPSGPPSLRRPDPGTPFLIISLAPHCPCESPSPCRVPLPSSYTLECSPGSFSSSLDILSWGMNLCCFLHPDNSLTLCLSV